MRLWIGFALVLGGVGAWWAGTHGTTPALIQAAAQTTQKEAARAAGAPESVGPRAEPVDYFHPDRDTPVEPAYGGTLRLHLENLPRSLNAALENAQAAKNLLFELHATLLRRDWETWEFVPELARDWERADTLVLGAAGTDGERTLYGTVREDGDAYELVPLDAVPGARPERYTRATVARVERQTVVTFHLREGVRWQDGHPFDADDVIFSWRIAQNPAVTCDWVRPYLLKIVRAEALDAHTVRFFFGEQYFNARGVFTDNLCILPRHLYDLRDPDHASFQADASDEACAREINENPHNTQWIGLGAYRLTAFSQQGVECERNPDYFDPEHGGYFDRIVWRHIANDEATYQALLDREIDFTVRISSDQYFGEATARPAFSDHYYKGYFYLGAFNYLPWNTRRPLLADVRVRKALAQSMDMEEYVRTVAHGLALLPTGFQCYFGPAYDHDVQRLPFDLESARERFAEAGWYDRDGDGVIDKDGQPFELHLMIQSGSKGSEIFARMFQESLAKVGVRLVIEPLDWATYMERLNARDFDAGIGSWAVDVTENDPVQLWHSQSAGRGGSNHAGVIDPHVDELIARGARELDDEKRWATWRELHRYLYEEVQPYLYREMPPRKFALSKAVRGVQFFKVNPGYSPRRWFLPAGTPGTRPTR